MLRQCATTAITAVNTAPIRFAMAAMLGRLVAQLKMPRLDAYRLLADGMTVWSVAAITGVSVSAVEAVARGVQE